MSNCDTCGSAKMVSWHTYLSMLSGWKNLIFTSARIEEIARNRAQICSSCDQLMIKELFCKNCNCLVMAKIRSEYSRCCLDKWLEIVKSNINQNQTNENRR